MQPHREYKKVVITYSNFSSLNIFLIQTYREPKNNYTLYQDREEYEKRRFKKKKDEITRGYGEDAEEFQMDYKVEEES